MSWKTDRALIGALSRDREPDDPELIAARTRFYAARLEHHVREVLAKAPPFSPEQKEHIAAILLTGGAA